MAEIKVDVEVLEELSKTARKLSKALEDASIDIKENKEWFKEKIEIPTEKGAMMRSSGCSACGGCTACVGTFWPDIEVAWVALVSYLADPVWLSQ